MSSSSAENSKHDDPHISATTSHNDKMTSRRHQHQHRPDYDDDDTPPPLLNRRMRPRPSSPPPDPCSAPTRHDSLNCPSDEDRSDRNNGIMAIASLSMEDTQLSSPRHENHDGMMESPAIDNNEQQQQHFATVEQQQEEESIRLARQLMEEEAMESYARSADYLRHNAAEFSQEDYEALQAALAAEEAEASDEQDDGGEDLTYDMMLRLGETIGDVKQERWAWIAQSEIDKLPTFKFDPESVKDKDENDPNVKCLVCQCSYEKDEELRRLPCGHYYHCNCVDQWLREKDFCPYCRTTIVDTGGADDGVNGVEGNRAS